MNLQEVRKLIESSPDYDVRILKTEFLPELLKIEFSVDNIDNSDAKKFELKVYGIVNYHITENYDESSQFYIEEDHPLLWQYTDTQCELYVTGSADSFKELFFDLLSIHFSLFESYIPFNPASAIVLEKGFGLFQRGSKKLLKIYAEKLQSYGIQTSIVENYTKESKLAVLFLGNSYFIAESFDFKSLN
ncbi:MAG: hypothetical protein V4642_09855 [Bacteroidota bacterium]